MPDWSRLSPRFVTGDSANRRVLYRLDERRQREEEHFAGPPEAFLKSIDLRCTISRAEESDLMRAEELTVRTHQLNATGVPYSFARLNALRQSADHRLLMCELTDRYGSYGKVGLALLKTSDTALHLKLLLVSCRVLSRGVGTLLLTYLMQLARRTDRRLTADFRKTDKNRLMYLTYSFANFREKYRKADGALVLENDLSVVPGFPAYVRMQVPDADPRQPFL
jgi:FkbH-like protein